MVSTKEADLTPEIWTIMRIEMTRYTDQQKLDAVIVGAREGWKVADELAKERFLEDIAVELDKALVVQPKLTLRLAECGEANAYYDPDTKTIDLCLELLTDLRRQRTGKDVGAAAGAPLNDRGDVALGVVLRHRSDGQRGERPQAPASDA